MMVTLGVYVSPDGDYTAYERQRVVLEDALKKYGTDHIAGITGELTCNAPMKEPLG